MSTPAFCPELLKRGPRKGEPCRKKALNNNKFCSVHKKAPVLLLCPVFCEGKVCGKNLVEYDGVVCDRVCSEHSVALASEKGNLELVKCLVWLGSNIHLWNDYAVRLASRYGHLEVVKYLVSVGADIHAKNDYAFRFASWNGHLEVVKYLVSVGADIHATDEHAHNDDAIRSASTAGHLEVVKYLVSVGADIHANDEQALRWASQNGHLEVVKYLVSMGADTRVKNDYAFRSASERGHVEVVMYLMSLHDQEFVDKEQECEICTFVKTRFVKCKTCIHEICLDCKSNLVQDKCPFCRTKF